jgi:hypothetical protein
MKPRPRVSGDRGGEGAAVEGGEVGERRAVGAEGDRVAAEAADRARGTPAWPAATISASA